MADQLPDVMGAGGMKRESRPTFITGGMFAGALSTGTILDAAALQERGFTGSTGSQSVAAGQRLTARVINPLESGRRVIMYRRQFGNDRQGNDAQLVRRITFDGTTPLDNPVTSAGLPLNRRPGAAPSVVTFEWSVGASSPTVGQFAEGMTLNGVPEIIELVSIVYPGQALGYVVDGQGEQALSQQAVASILLGWAEEDYDA